MALGVFPGASLEEIKTAYREKARELHPDAGGDVGAFTELALAFHAVEHKKDRDKYDRSLAMLHHVCSSCEGSGIKYTARNTPKRCSHCLGIGYSEKERKRNDQKANPGITAKHKR